MKKKTLLVTFVAAFIVSYALMYGFYLFISVGLPDKTIFLQMRRYIPNALAVAAAICLWRKSGAPWKNLWSHALVAISWAVVYPLSYWLTFHKSSNFIDNHFDISFAAYVFAFLVVFRVLLDIWGDTVTRRKIASVIIAVEQTILMAIPLTQIWYYFTYQSPITEAACMAMLQTNGSEMREYMSQIVGASGMAGIAVVVIVMFLAFALGNKYKPGPGLSRKATILTVVIFVATGVYGVKIFPETGVLDVLHNAQDYFDNSKKFDTYHADKFQDLTVTVPEKTFSKPSTIIMVIGESASKDFCSAYTYTDHDTTPWMKSMSATPNGLLFQHAYTSWGQTVPALERALTEKNQYNDLEFNQCITILDIAKKAGYTTYWFSNQGTIGNADTPITLVAKTADHATWIEDDLANTDEKKYDEDLLPYLKQVDPTKNNFIILHIMGSHDSYDNRYPPEFAKWSASGKEAAVTNYDNSIAYTDDFLQKVYTYGTDHLNLQAMLYFSDHGADPMNIRHPDHAPFEGLRIPMFLFLSDEYKQLYPETYSVLQSHKNTYFTNDLLYEFMCGIFHITSNHYDETNSLTSNQYKYTRDMLTTELGKEKLTEDTKEN